MSKPDNSKKYFRFTPSTYNTTQRIVKNLHLGNAIFMENGDVLIEYITESEITLFFFRLQLHTLTPEDIDPPIDPKEIRNLKRTNQSRIFIFVLQAVALIGVAIYLLFFKT